MTFIDTRQSNLGRILPLGDVTEAVATTNPATRNLGRNFNYIDLSAIDQDKKLISGARSVVATEAPSRARQVVHTGDVLVSTVRPNLNGVAKVEVDHDGYVASTGFCVLRPKQGKLDPGFLFHWVRSPRFIDAMVNRATGASYPAVSDAIVRSSHIPCPPIAEQRRIVAILDQADGLWGKRVVAAANIKLLREAVFQDMFGDPMRNVMGYQTSRLGCLVDGSRGISYGIVQRGPDQDEGVGVLRISDIAGGTVNANKLKLTTAQIAGRFKRTRLLGGELVISIRGTIGVVAIVPDEIFGANVSRELAVIPLKEGVSRTFMRDLLSTKTVQQRIVDDVRGIAQSGINLEDLRELSIICPPVSFVSEYERRVGVVEELERREMLSVSFSAKLFASLQHRAFRGEL